MATTASKSRPYLERQEDLPLRRGARIGLLLLLVVTVAFAFGVLFIKYQLEAFRADVALGLEERFGARLAMGDISVNGLRGLRIENLRMEFPLEQGPVLNFSTPYAYIHIELADLLYGRITVERIIIDRSRIELKRPEGATWYSNEAPNLDDVIPFEVSRSSPYFRITGADCKLAVENIVGNSEVRIDDFSFDIARLVDASDLTAVLHGHLEGEPDKRMSVRLFFASFEDFDLRIETSLITAEDVNVVMPADEPIVLAGAAHPTLRINGRPERTLLVSLEAPFENIAVRDQPEFLDPFTGTLNVLATYSFDDKNLYFTTAKAQTGQIDGSVEGDISFATERPEFDLRVHARRIPIREILDYSLEGELEDVGRMDLILDEPHELEITVTGDSDQPILRGETRAAAGTFEFEPKDKDLPPIRLSLRQIEGAWDSYTQDVRLAFDIADGAIPYEQWGITAESLRGHVTLENSVISVAPLNAVCRGNTFVGDGQIDLASGDGRLRFEGTLAQVEDTALEDAIPRTRLAGAVSVKGEARRTGGLYSVEADVDATQTDIRYEWWLRKAPGVGASGRIRAEIDPDSIANFDVIGEAASSQLVAEASAIRNPNKESGWDLDTVRATSDRIDVNSASKLAVVPYRVTGGTVRLAYFEYRHDPDDYSRVHQRFGGFVDDLSLIAIDEGAAIPMTGKAVTMEFELQSHRDRSRAGGGVARIDADQINMPPFGQTWFVPLNPPPDWDPIDRNWGIDLRAANMELPPWKGREFEGHAFTDQSSTGISAYRALVGDGEIEGTYKATRSDNRYVTTSKWTRIPAHFLLDHLKMPSVLEGAVSGEVIYSVDRDDPGTLEGTGAFEVRDGRFSADFLADFLEGNLKGDLSSMPPKLDFEVLSSRVELAGDTVKTPGLMLDSETLRAEGSGQYIRDGDINYRLKVAVSPDTAARIPLMASNFNIQGHRLSGTPIELTFQIGGPTFNPRGRVEELPPASVTLMSGALEVTRETIGLIDFPRKILVDLLKIGGGIVGGGEK